MNSIFENLTRSNSVIERLAALGYDEPSLNIAISNHKASLEGNPAVYCSTYGKYNRGSLEGMWIDLTTFNDFNDFINFCKALHADENSPELMFQDFEGYPGEWYSESGLDEDTFDKINDYYNLSEEFGSEAVQAFFSWRPDASADDFRDSYCGQWDGEGDFAYNIIEDCYPEMIEKMGNLACYFNYEAFTRDLFMTDYYESDGHVFRAF